MCPQAPPPPHSYAPAVEVDPPTRFLQQTNQSTLGWLLYTSLTNFVWRVWPIRQFWHLTRLDYTLTLYQKSRQVGRGFMSNNMQYVSIDWPCIMTVLPLPFDGLEITPVPRFHIFGQALNCSYPNDPQFFFFFLQCTKETWGTFFFLSAAPTEWPPSSMNVPEWMTPTLLVFGLNLSSLSLCGCGMPPPHCP